jgi:hypothetical protein
MTVLTMLVSMMLIQTTITVMATTIMVTMTTMTMSMYCHHWLSTIHTDTRTTMTTVMVNARHVVVGDGWI